MKGARYGSLAALAVVVLVGVALYPRPVREETPTLAPLPADSAAARDAPTLALWSEAAGVPTLLTEAVAWTESGRSLDPTLRGAAGEVGRFQIKPATARERCPRQNIMTYHGNLACYLRMMRENYAACRDWRCAIARYNGQGPAAAAYAGRVLAFVERRVLAEVAR